MIEASGAFDAWGSALVGGLASAVAVLLAVFVTFHLTNRKARETERREAAAQLMVEVSNLRDAACSHRTGPIGDYALYQLRNALYTTYVPLHKYRSFHIVDEFYETVKAWREWARKHDDRSSHELQRTRSRRVEQSFPWTVGYMTELGKYGEAVIDVLKKRLELTDPGFMPPVLPSFDDTPVKVRHKSLAAQCDEMEAGIAVRKRAGPRKAT